jgi:hypothetical protein
LRCALPVSHQLRPPTTATAPSATPRRTAAS